MRLRIASLVALAALVQTSVASARDTAAVPPPIVKANNAFALSAFGVIRAGEGNHFFSPFSLSTALAMTAAGAKGKTRKEMDAALRFEGIADAKLHAGYRSWLAQLGQPDKASGYQLAVANRLWGQASYKFRKGFLALTKKQYGAGLARVDFKTATQKARKTINAWVAKQTRDRIKELLGPTVLKSSTRLVLTNAIWFKGSWTTKFDKRKTREDDFFASPTTKVKAKFMRARFKTRYGTAPGVQLLELPYGKVKHLAMLIALPRDKNGLATVEAGLNAATFQRWRGALRSTKVIMKVPRWRTESSVDAKKVLKKLGMKAAFDRTAADFSGMEPKKELYITDVVHKAFVEVTEEGTEAAAATAVVMGRKGAGPRPAQPARFIADHPFLYFIVDRRSNAILFMGRLAKP